jgi:hypothetical protein
MAAEKRRRKQSPKALALKLRRLAWQYCDLDETDPDRERVWTVLVALARALEHDHLRKLDRMVSEARRFAEKRHRVVVDGKVVVDVTPDLLPARTEAQEYEQALRKLTAVLAEAYLALVQKVADAIGPGGALTTKSWLDELARGAAKDSGGRPKVPAKWDAELVLDAALRAAGIRRDQLDRVKAAYGTTAARRLKRQKNR